MQIVHCLIQLLLNIFQIWGGNYESRKINNNAKKQIGWQGIVTLNALLLQHNIGSDIHSQVYASRLDLAYDGFPLSPLDLQDIWEHDPDKIGVVQDMTVIQKKNRRGDSLGTVYLGSRQTERFVRLYDARGLNRLEFELKGNWAKNVFSTALVSGLDWSIFDALCRSYLGKIDKVALWLLEQAKNIVEVAIIPKIRRFSRSVERQVSWMYRSVSKVYAGLSMALPLDFFEELSRVGSNKLTRADIQFYTQ